MKRSYFSVTYLPANCDYFLLAGRCISVLHGYLSRFGLNGIGVSFPKWTLESTRHIRSTNVAAVFLLLFCSACGLYCRIFAPRTMSKLQKFHSRLGMRNLPLHHWERWLAKPSIGLFPMRQRVRAELQARTNRTSMDRWTYGHRPIVWKPRQSYIHACGGFD